MNGRWSTMTTKPSFYPPIRCNCPFTPTGSNWTMDDLDPTEKKLPKPSWKICRMDFSLRSCRYTSRHFPLCSSWKPKSQINLVVKLLCYNEWNLPPVDHCGENPSKCAFPFLLSNATFFTLIASSCRHFFNFLKHNYLVLCSTTRQNDAAAPPLRAVAQKMHIKTANAWHIFKCIIFSASSSLCHESSDLQGQIPRIGHSSARVLHDNHSPES